MTTTADFSVKPTLTGERVLLRPFAEEDLPAMLAALRDPEVLRLTGSPRYEPDEDGATRTWYLTRAEQTDRLDLAVVDRATGRCVGEVVLNEWDPDNRSCNFRTLFGPEGRGRGLGTEACRLIVTHAFETLGLNRVSLGVYAFNPRARRAYEKVGFVAEGTEREALWTEEDGWVDSTYMSVLAREWAVHRGHPAV
ncbi:acetyltransferase [Streptomyces spiroverticillatus]|uniref:Acetyltransferase n=1 Tax=Streptomyces finlayi TaxID=67296 RepID=A0A918WY17_9ACTN|nr:GNAT family protein [Streptomyces finlayi]GHA11303.1 acetyltransferase [Streptomyces spiroverticillatus]GHC95072.1 acetyltransferase [Streptomyces finlayi]